MLRELRLGAPISRVGLAERTGISKPAVTRGITDLIEEGLVIETGRGESTSAGGKRPTLLELNGRAAAGLGCVVEVGKVRATLAGFNGEFEATHETDFDPQAGPEIAMAALKGVLHGVVDRNAAGRLILGLGVSVPGPVDEEGRVVVMPHLQGWKGVPVADILHDQLGIPVQVDNESRVQALAEGWFGLGRGVENFVCLETGVGVSAGVVMNGRLCRGLNSLAGEVGHWSTYGDGRRCYCDSRACWEINASTTQFLADLETASIAHNDVKLHAGKLSVRDVAHAVEVGDATARAELEAHADALARGICNLVLAYDPERIILHGDANAFGERLVRMLKRRVRDRFALWLEYDPPIMLSELGDDVGLAGAVSLALRSAWGLEEPSAMVQAP
ncbi:MAG: ROK family transcriptional regulator [bacterium]